MSAVVVPSSNHSHASLHLRDLLLLLRTSAIWTTIHLPDARTSHLRTLSKIFGRGLSAFSRYPTLPPGEPPIIARLLLPSTPCRALSSAFPRRRPEPFRPREPHILARFQRTSTPCEAVFSSSPPASDPDAPAPPWRGANCAASRPLWEGVGRKNSQLTASAVTSHREPGIRRCGKTRAQSATPWSSAPVPGFVATIKSAEYTGRAPASWLAWLQQTAKSPGCSRPNGCAKPSPILSSTAIWSPVPQRKEIGREDALFRTADHRLPA